MDCTPISSPDFKRNENRSHLEINGTYYNRNRSDYSYMESFSPGGDEPNYYDVSYNYSDDSDGPNIYTDIEGVLYTKIMIVICAFGMLGNILNLVVLTRKSLSSSMARLERSAHMGLVALATSDLVICMAAFPHAIQDMTTFDYPNVTFWLVYTVYNNAVINIFIMSSTWLTVAMALSRYVAICYPLQARQFVGVNSSRVSIAVVFSFCVAFNLPRFWMSKIDFINCEEGGRRYFENVEGPFKSFPAEKVYNWIYFLLGILIPLIVLVYCNVYLIRALRASTKMREQHARSTNKARESKNIVTLTLSVIVVMYLTLVIPAEALNFFKSEEVSYDAYNLAVAFCNTLQAINFAVNFILYCVINVHFRKTIQAMCCGGGQSAREYDSVSQSGQQTMRLEEKTYNTVC